MSQSFIEVLNEKMQDAFLGDFDDYLSVDKSGRYSGLYRGFNLDSVFQPIATGSDHRTIGYEALLRPTIGKTLPVEPKFVFRYIEETGGLVFFDRICRTLHLLNFLGIKEEHELLFINVHPALLSRVDAHGKVFEAIVHAHSVPVDQVVIELEESFLDDRNVLDKALRNFRDRGFKIAIADFGRELTYVKRLWNITPDFVKLHGDLIHEAAVNEKVSHVLPRIIDLIHETGGEVVVQGIETEQQLSIAEQSGAKYRQGYALSKPEPASHWLERIRLRDPIRKAGW
ncbi:EAL domain-containing protein [Methylomicrobium sp. Wu6]|uniref:EAL domain-containing protein n=1 Tax=Methylomicrobium sp. Wu6 TaxID=3107928 RepID=UPI002DD673E1|nr:EAL domain-containing protein [Methylomicrobium sp. Wu6]MEC4749619.1 EAL domain-containing protein [Methylomicrobium sp. Wu6]